MRFHFTCQLCHHYRLHVSVQPYSKSTVLTATTITTTVSILTRFSVGKCKYRWDSDSSSYIRLHAWRVRINRLFRHSPKGDSVWNTTHYPLRTFQSRLSYNFDSSRLTLHMHSITCLTLLKKYLCVSDDCNK